MCFTAQEPEDRIKLIAQEDIVCYKIMTQTFFKRKLYSYLYKYNYKYSYNEEYIAKINNFETITGLEMEPLADEVIYGFHSYISKEYTEYEKRNFYDSRAVIIECVIPKGSEYYKNRKEYVSHKIKFIRKIK